MNHPDTPHIEKLIVCRTECRGEGTEANPNRLVTQVFREDGTLLAERDPWMYQQIEKKKKDDEVPF